MSTELDRAIDALRARADGAVLPPAVELRARSDHRRRLTVAATVAAVTVLVLGVALGASVLRPTAAVTPAVTPSVTATPGPTAEPTPSVEPTLPPDPTGSPVHLPAGCIGDDPYVMPNQGPKVAGEALPASMMLTAANWGRCWVVYEDVGGYLVRDEAHAVETTPFVCEQAGPYAADEQRVAGRYRDFLAGPETGGYQTVTRYRPGQAASLMDEVRAAVQVCHSYLPVGDGITYYALIVETGFAGDESLMVYTGTSPTPTKDTYPASYLAVVRVGDLVTVVEPSFDLGGDRAMAKTLAQKAAAKL